MIKAEIENSLVFYEKQCYFVEIPYQEGPCTEGRQCVTPNAICLNARCVCDANAQFFKNGACYTSKYLACESSAPCV